MRLLFTLAIKSLANRRFTMLLMVFSIGISTALLLGVERLRVETHTSFSNTISGTDLIMGARGGSAQLLLYSVFRMGQATHNIHWQSYEWIQDHPRVAWSIPITLGDSHAGYPVMGTTDDYFHFYRFGQNQSLAFAQGKPFDDLFDAVIGAEVAEQLGYKLGDEIIVAHGSGPVSFVDHDNMPFTISGILKRTGTPVDNTVHISLDGFEAIHIGWHQGAAPGRGQMPSPDEARELDLTPRTITAVLLGLDSRVATFQVQRAINDYRGEPLQAILPGVALQELWRLIGTAERVLLAVSSMVVVVGLIGMLTVLLAGLNERRREMAILRSIGARPWQIFGVLMAESALLTLLGILLGTVILYAGLFIAQPMLLSQLGLMIYINLPSQTEWLLLAVIMAAGTSIGALPGALAYQRSLADGLTPKT